MTNATITEITPLSAFARFLWLVSAAAAHRAEKYTRAARCVDMYAGGHGIWNI
jgi:hypothetical protein